MQISVDFMVWRLNGRIIVVHVYDANIGVNPACELVNLSARKRSANASVMKNFQFFCACPSVCVMPSSLRVHMLVIVPEIVPAKKDGFRHLGKGALMRLRYLRLHAFVLLALTQVLPSLTLDLFRKKIAKNATREYHKTKHDRGKRKTWSCLCLLVCSGSFQTFHKCEPIAVWFDRFWE